MNSSKSINRINESVCAIVPFYNEKGTLLILLSNTLSYVTTIIAVNDGSTDDLYIPERNKQNVRVIDLEKNFGKGRALSVGFEEAIRQGFEYVVTLDADLQHDPNFIPDLLQALDRYDIVIGNRLNSLKDMPFQRRLSNKLTSYFLTKKTGQKIIDSQCGFRAYRAEVLRNVKTNYMGYEAESEMLIRAARSGFKIGFIDIPTIYGNEKSKMKPVQAIFGFIKVLIST